MVVDIITQTVNHASVASV